MRPFSRPPSSTWLILASLFLAISPTTHAADKPPVTTAAKGKVLLLPFVGLNKSEQQPWLGKSVQQSLLADLTVVAPGRVIAMDTEAADATAALEAGRKLGARYVVHGSFVTVGQDLRVTGEVLDVNTGNAVTALKVTGAATNVFVLEDDLADQIRRRLALATPQPRLAPVAQLTPVATAPAFEGVRMHPQPVDPYREAYVIPTQEYQSPARAQIEYNYYYSSPYAGYFATPYWGWFWPGLVGFYSYP
jgi:TolB-like protein